MSILIENTRVDGWDAAIRGMRNPMNSWEKSDSSTAYGGKISVFFLGKNDQELMIKLTKAGTDHSKFLRMINVTMDITAPLYWWKEWDTYKVGTVANSCSTMHKIHAKKFELADFSHEHLTPARLGLLEEIIGALNSDRSRYTDTKDKNDWWQMIQLLPSSYNQKRTVQLNYAVCMNIYNARKTHKLDEWRTLCAAIEKFPYFKSICIDPLANPQ